MQEPVEERNPQPHGVPGLRPAPPLDGHHTGLHSPRVCDLLSTKPGINLVTKNLWLCSQNPSVLAVAVFLEKMVVAPECVWKNEPGAVLAQGGSCGLALFACAPGSSGP